VGETEQRLYELDAWRETPFYTERERAAVAWDRGADSGFPNARSRFWSTTKFTKQFQRKRDCGSNACRFDDQPLEPPGDLAPRGAGAL